VSATANNSEKGTRPTGSGVDDQAGAYQSLEALALTVSLTLHFAGLQSRRNSRGAGLRDPTTSESLVLTYPLYLAITILRVTVLPLAVTR
jgi:hypothetical protein